MDEKAVMKADELFLEFNKLIKHHMCDCEQLGILQEEAMSAVISAVTDLTAHIAVSTGAGKSEFLDFMGKAYTTCSDNCEICVEEDVIWN